MKAYVFSRPGCRAVGRSRPPNRSRRLTTFTCSLMDVVICQTSSLFPGYFYTSLVLPRTQKGNVLDILNVVTADFNICNNNLDYVPAAIMQ